MVMPRQEKYDKGTFVVMALTEDGPIFYETNSFKKAVTEYRTYRVFFGDCVRLVKVVVNYGEEI